MTTLRQVRTRGLEKALTDGKKAGSQAASVLEVLFHALNKSIASRSIELKRLFKVLRGVQRHESCFFGRRAARAAADSDLAHRSCACCGVHKGGDCIRTIGLSPGAELAQASDVDAAPLERGTEEAVIASVLDVLLVVSRRALRSRALFNRAIAVSVTVWRCACIVESPECECTVHVHQPLRCGAGAGAGAAAQTRASTG